MAEEFDNEEELNQPEDQNDGQEVNGDNDNGDNIVPLSGLYEEWFLDYASYVILERAVPALLDGLKPVQRRILHSMKEMDDGRYNKVANIIGNTMKYHPHGDASIGDALVQMGQKDLLIDCQGNWGNTLTGDSAAAPRYIEARLNKFANHVVFNPKTTEWSPSYDGRNNEPVLLPVKFPLLLAQGAEGIAVGMACKILPHNFIELIDNCINHLKGRKVEIFPDFPNGGMADFSKYNDGLRGGKVRVRAHLDIQDKKTIVINSIPFGSTTTSLIDSILKANDKGKIKIRKVEDNTASEPEIVLHLPSGVSPEKTIDALYAFTDCESSISPNASVIDGDKPKFVGVSQMLKESADNTLKLLELELKIKQKELEEQWHFSSLEKIFIENKIYIEFDGRTYEEAIEVTHKLLKPHIKHLVRAVTDDDVKRLLEIRMRRITKHDAEKADTYIANLEEQLAEVKHNLEHIVDYTIDYYKELKDKFGKGKERKTAIQSFDTVNAKTAIIANRKLYVNRKEGFIGWSLKKDEYICDASEIDDVIIFLQDGSLQVTKIADKKFVGKNIIHATVWKKGDERTIYHMIYRDGGPDGPSMMKRFKVSSLSRDKVYDLTKGTKSSRVLYFTANPNGERETVTVHLKMRPHLKRIRFDIDFGELLIKGRGSMGNKATKDIISKIVQKEVGESTLGAVEFWFDDVVKRLNRDGRGKSLGKFKGSDKILTLYKDGTYRLISFDLSHRFDDTLLHIEKWNPEHPISVAYYNKEKDLPYAKRFLCEVTTDKVVPYIDIENGDELFAVSTAYQPVVKIVFNKHLKATKHLPDEIVRLDEFISVKGMKSQGNQLTKLKTKEIVLEGPIEGSEPWPEPEKRVEDNKPAVESEDAVTVDINSEGTTEIELNPKNSGPIKFDDDDSQSTLF